MINTLRYTYIYILEEIPPLFAPSQQYQKHYANDAEELERSFETKAHSEKTMNVIVMNVIDEDGFLSRSMMIKAKDIIMKERIWITVKLTIQNRVAKVDVEPNATSVDQFKEFKTARANVQEVRLKVSEFASLTTSEFVSQYIGYKPNNVWSGLKPSRRALCSTREMSRMKCGHPGNFLVDCTGVVPRSSALKEVRKL